MDLPLNRGNIYAKRFGDLALDIPTSNVSTVSEKNAVRSALSTSVKTRTDEWRSSSAMSCLQCRRQVDCGTCGVALALDLLQEIEELRSRLKTFEIPPEPDATG